MLSLLVHIVDRLTLSPALTFDTKAARALTAAESCQCLVTATNCNLFPAPMDYFGDLEFDSVAGTVLDRIDVVSAPLAVVHSWGRRSAVEDFAELAGTFRPAESRRQGIAD